MVGDALIHVITVTYNSSRIILPFLSTLDLGQSQLRVSVVDSGSDDAEDLSRLLKGLPVDLRLLKNNVGYGTASNVGAASSSAEWLAFVNPDVEVSSRTLRTLATRASDQGIACIGPTVRAPGTTSTSRLRRPWRRWMRSPSLHTPVDGVEYARFISGCCMVVNRAAFEKVGGFDEDFFMFSEEVDLQRRLWLSGLTVARSGRDGVVTAGGASSAGVTRRWSKAERDVAYVQFALKHYGWPGFLAGVVYRGSRILLTQGYEPRRDSLLQYSNGIARVLRLRRLKSRAGADLVP